jgi:hypothetical protein
MSYPERFLSLALVSFLLLAVALLPESARAQLPNGPEACLSSSTDPGSVELESAVVDTVDYLKTQARQTDDYVSLLNQHGVSLPVSQNDSLRDYWHDTSNGGRVWCLRVRAAVNGGDSFAGSFALAFEELSLPGDAEVRVYADGYGDRDDPSNDYVLAYQNSQPSSFTSDTVLMRYAPTAPEVENPDTKNRKELMISLYEPEEQEGQAALYLDGVAYGFLSADRLGQSDDNHFNADPTSDCPTSTPWASQIHAAVQLVKIGQYGQRLHASATLLNNLSEDLTPYVYFARHTVPGSEYQPGDPFGQNTVFDSYLRLNYQSDNFCETGKPSSLPSYHAVPVDGATVQAQGRKYREDFLLAELPEKIPPAYRVQYAGWSATGNTPQQGAVIGHPKGDVKKISVDFDPLSSGPHPLTGASDAVWETDGYEIGTAPEGGSSGSPLLDKSRRFVGHALTPDDFPKLSVNWTYGSAGNQLKDVLANGTGQKTLPSVAGYNLNVSGKQFADSTSDYSSGFFRTAGRIDVEDVTVESDGGRLVLRAREGIHIDGPFVAEAGSEFEMRIDDGPHLSDMSFPAASSSATVASTSGASQTGNTGTSKSAQQEGKQEAAAATKSKAGEQPEKFALHAPYPNPSDGQVTVRYALPEKAHVEIALYDALGRRVGRLASEQQPASTHRLTFDAAELSSGTYFIHMRTGDFAETQAVTLVR